MLKVILASSQLDRMRTISPLSLNIITRQIACKLQVIMLVLTNHGPESRLGQSNPSARLYLGVVRDVGRISAASNFKRLDDGVNLLHLLFRQLDQLGVLFYSGCGCCTGDGDDGWSSWAVALAVHPADGELSRGAALLLGESLNLSDQLEIVVKGGLFEAGELGDESKALDL